MPTYQQTNISAAVGGAAAIDIQPAAGDGYCITDFFSDTAFVGTVPDMSVALRDGVLADCVVIIDPTTAVQKEGRSKELYINNATYLRLTNTAAGAANLGWTGYQVSPNIIMTDIVTAPNGGFVVVQPPAGQVWKVLEIGCETMNAANWPDLSVYITDGVLLASLMAVGTRNLVWPKKFNIYISNTIYLRLEPIAGADRDVGLSMIRVDVEQFADVVDIGGSANLDIQPPVGQDVALTQFSAETWAGVAPAGSPDVDISLFNGAVLSDIQENGTAGDNAIANREYEIFINNAVYIRVTEVSTGNNEFGYTGYVVREYNT